MAAKKGKPEMVHPALARRALAEAQGDRQAAWTQYILAHFRATGSLAPGCNMADLQAWYREHAGEGQA